MLYVIEKLDNLEIWNKNDLDVDFDFCFQITSNRKIEILRIIEDLKSLKNYPNVPKNML